MAPQVGLEPTTLRLTPEQVVTTLDCRDGGHSQRFHRAVGQIEFRDKGAEPIDVLPRPLAHVAPEAEVRSLRLSMSLVAMSNFLRVFSIFLTQYGLHRSS